METYSLLREIADSWVLLAMFVFFVGVAIWAFLPSQADARKEAQMIPFREDAPDVKKPCAKACADCACSALVLNLEGQGNG